MGDAADDAYDKAMEEYEDILLYLSCTNKELVEFTKMSRSPKIMGIRHYYNSYSQLTEKQRFCLANWAYEHMKLYS